MNAAFLSGKSILVADDEKFSRQIVSRHLRDYGDPQIEQAGSGSEALVILSDHAKKCDAVIFDVMMPGLSGLSVLRAIRTGFNGIRRDLPVLTLTGNSDTELVSSALLLDVDGFLVKPVSKVALAGRMAKAIASAGSFAPCLSTPASPPSNGSASLPTSPPAWMKRQHHRTAIRSRYWPKRICSSPRYRIGSARK